MAAAACHIASTSLRWVDKFHGRASEELLKVSGGFTGDLHNVSTQFLAGSTTVPDAGFALNEIIEIGTKIKVCDPATGLSATFIYGQLIVQGATLAAGSVVRTAYATSNATFDECVLTNDPDLWMWAAGIGPSALALSAMTNTYLGWFMCGGYVPQTDATAVVWGVTALKAATVKGYHDVAVESGAAALVAGDHVGTDAMALVTMSNYQQTPDAYSFTVFTND
ncbi:MAG TPA: hypothetical protein VMZ92_09210 [Planctomycetota bacterium]|nr:hypothetical protein [Planctomycetota bacterium]